jgi:NAD(P)-dependent dehydrogenase (short-subunit alcohol dehydrogenase family)
VKPTGRLTGRVAIVTGAAQGLGAEYAQALAAQGAAVVAADVADATAVVEIITASGGNAIALKVDVTDAASVRQMIDEAVRQFGGLDILINNAALFSKLPLRRFEDIDSAEWDRVMAVNVRGTFECSKAAVSVMRKKRYGKIINIGSGTVFKGSPLRLHYVASKGAIVAMTRCLARELGDDGIRVNTLAPGQTMTEAIRAHPDRKGGGFQNNIASRALKREALPKDMCGTLIYLCSSDSDFVTGQVIIVDGGSVMH